MMDGRKGTIVYINIVGMIFGLLLLLFSFGLLVLLGGVGGVDTPLIMIDSLCWNVCFGFALLVPTTNGANFRGGDDDDKNELRLRLLP